MATPATQERTIPNPAITSVPQKEVTESQPQQDEISDVFQGAPDTSTGFWSKLSNNMGRYSDRYAEIKSKTDYLTQI